MQHRIAIIYGTSEGQTQKIAHHMEARFEARGEDVAVMHADELPLDYALENSDGIIIGASIHVGRHQDFVLDYVSGHAAELARRPNAFFSVSLSSGVGQHDKAAEYIEQFRETSGWSPRLVGQFGGALQYSKYNFITRPMMRRIAEQAGADTDTSQDWEYTDWDEVDRFADQFLGMMDAWREAGRPALAD